MAAVSDSAWTSSGQPGAILHSLADVEAPAAVVPLVPHQPVQALLDGLLRGGRPALAADELGLVRPRPAGERGGHVLGVRSGSARHRVGDARRGPRATSRSGIESCGVKVRPAARAGWLIARSVGLSEIEGDWSDFASVNGSPERSAGTQRGEVLVGQRDDRRVEVGPRPRARAGDEDQRGQDHQDHGMEQQARPPGREPGQPGRGQSVEPRERSGGAGPGRLASIEVGRTRSPWSSGPRCVGPWSGRWPARILVTCNQQTRPGLRIFNRVPRRPGRGEGGGRRTSPSLYCGALPR